LIADNDLFDVGSEIYIDLKASCCTFQTISFRIEY